MAHDSSLLFYDGEALSMSVLAAAFEAALDGHLGKATLAIAHSRVPIVGSAVRAVAVFEPPLLTSLSTEASTTLRKSTDQLVRRDASLISLLQAGFKVVRREIVEGRLSSDTAAFPRDWLLWGGTELSKASVRVLWVAVHDFTGSGSHAICEGGAVVERCDYDADDDFERRADRALTVFSASKRRSTRAAFKQLDPSSDSKRATDFAMISEGGRFLSKPRPVTRDALRDFGHVS